MFIVAVLGILALVLASLVFVLVSIVTITSIKEKLNNGQPDKRVVQTTSSSVPRARTQPVTRSSAPAPRYGSSRSEEGGGVTWGSYGPREHVQPLGRNEAESSDLLPSGYRRSEYHRHGATDDDIDFWRLDRPGAPSPGIAGWAVWDLVDEMDADVDPFDDPFDDPIF